MNSCDVVIIGGGPVGCLLSILLSDMGITNTVIERDKEPYQLPRAIVMDDEIQRMFHDHGMGSWLETHTSRLEAADFVDGNGAHILGAEVPPMGLQGLPPVVVHYQPELDAMLRAQSVARGAQAHWGQVATSLQDKGDRCVVTLDDGTAYESRWVVGCDGASSWTRKQLGLRLEDLEFDQPWLVVDIELHDNAQVDLPLGVRQYCDAQRPATYVKGHRRYRRWEFQIQEHENAQQLNTEEGLWSLLSPWVTPADASIVRSAVYRFHAVVAPQLQKDNVFLAGDSAHQMPPFLGQGLNSGMRDAVNLAWKFAFVRRGLASEKILHTYTTERVPHVRSVVAHAADVGRLIDQLSGRVSHGINSDSGYGGARPAAHIESGLVYGDDERVGHQFWFHPDVSAAVVHNGASLVVVSSQEIELPKELHQLEAQVVVAPNAVGSTYAIVVRPDRYVAAVLKDAQELQMFATTVMSDVR
jgi:3-(3-hydroxy-phenyl)propionate hydroxylase